MLPSVKNTRHIKDTLVSKREDKKRINIRWNSALFFQIGIIVSLLLVFWAVESQWETSLTAIDTSKKRGLHTDPPVFTYTVEKPKPIEKAPEKKMEKPPKREAKKVSSFTEVKNTAPVTEGDVPDTEVRADVPVLDNPGTTSGTKEIIPSKRSLLGVQEVPVFPGCESLTDNNERRACFQSKINEFISRKFDVERFYGKYAGETKTINVQFTVGTSGEITEVKASSPNEDLTAEAKKVISKLPRMIPGKQDSQPVEVVYFVPITLQITY